MLIMNYYGRPALHPVCTHNCSTDYSLGSLHTTKPRPLAESVHWSMSFAAYPLHPLAGMPHELGNAVMKQGLSVPVPLYTAWQLPYPPLEQILSHSIFLYVPAGFWASRGSQVEGPFPLLQLPPRGTGFSLIPSCIFLSFHLTRDIGNFLAVLIV